MFWGLLLEEGKFYSQKVQKPFHVSMAALEPSGKGGQPLTVNLEQDGMDFILCTLKEETLYQQALDLNFAEGDEIKFFLSGKGTVHLTGYVVCEEDDDFGEEESSDEDEAPQLSEPVKEKSKAPEKTEKKAAIESKAKEESDESEEESEDDSDDDSDEEMEPPPKIKKPAVPDKKLEAEKKPEKPVAEKKKKPEKKAEPEKVEPKKVEPVEDSDEESDEDDSDESDSDEEVKTEKPVAGKEKKETKKAEAAKDSDDSDDDDEDESDSDDDGGIDFKKLMQETSSGDDDDDDDDIDMDEMDEEGADEDSDDSSEEEEAPPPKKAKKVTPASTPVSTPTTDKSKSKKEKRASILKEQSKATPEPVQAGKKRKEIDTPLQNGIDGSAKKNKKNKQDKDSPVKTPKKTLKGGILLEELQVGTGPESVSGKYVSVHYTGKLKSNNKEFDSNTSGKGFKFRLGGNEVIKGWDLGLVGMKVGGKRRLTIPAKMAYGDKGSAPEIPPKADLVFDVELKAVS